MSDVDPRYDFGKKGCVRGDSLRWVEHVKAKDADGDPQPVDLSAYGTWTGKARKTGPDQNPSVALSVTLETGDAANDTFVLALTAAQTVAMKQGVWTFDLEASIGPLTPFKGSVEIFRDYDHADA